MERVEKASQMEGWLSAIAAIIIFSEQEQDFVLAAKCEDVHFLIAERLDIMRKRSA